MQANDNHPAPPADPRLSPEAIAACDWACAVPFDQALGAQPDFEKYFGSLSTEQAMLAAFEIERRGEAAQAEADALEARAAGHIADMSVRDIKQARFWIQRWKAIGGGFVFVAAKDGIPASFDLARKPADSEKIERHYAKAEAALVKELSEHGGRKGINVARLVQEAMAPASTPANDPEPPAAA